VSDTFIAGSVGYRRCAYLDPLSYRKTAENRASVFSNGVTLQRADAQRRQAEVNGQEDEALAGPWAFEADTSRALGTASLGIDTVSSTCGLQINPLA
jgi:hypothetical protein